MTEEEQEIFRQDLKKGNRVMIILLILGLFITLMTCNSNKYERLQGEYNILNEQYEAQKKVVKTIEENRLKEKDSLNNEITKRETENKQLVASNDKLEDKIKSIKNRKITIPTDNPGLVNYFNDRYKTTENKVVEDKVGLTTDTAIDVSYELEEADKCYEIIPLKDEKIKNQDSIIVNLEKDKTDIKTQLTTAEEDIEQRKLLEQSADKNIKNLESQVSKLKTKGTLNKILIPVALIGGGFLGYQIAK